MFIKIANQESSIDLSLKFNKGLILAGAASGLSAFLYAMYVERHWLDVTRHTLEVIGLPEAWRGYKIAWLSDMHLGHSGSAKPVTNAVERAIAERPDLILLGGDYMDKGRWKPVCDEIFGRLGASGIPVVGVWGNHDYFGNRLDPHKNFKHMERHNIRILINETYCVERGGSRQYIIGLDDSIKGVPELRKPRAQIPPGEKPLVVLCHNPKYIRKLPNDFCELALSGHTHGGQINPAPPPFHRTLNWIRFTPTAEHYSPYSHAWYEVNGNRLYIGKGVGVTRWAVRFGARPELPIFELQPAV